VVILTADGRYQEQARALGAAAAFAKPFELDALLGTIERIAGPARPGARVSA
jgi:CheY-like chemotaxis protein